MMKMDRMSREVAIDRLKEINGDPTILQPVMRYKKPLEMAIEALAKPEIIHCKDCRYYEEFTDSISSKATKGCTLYYVEKDEQGFCDEARKK